jgi:hypothetical protein
LLQLDWTVVGARPATPATDAADPHGQSRSEKDGSMSTTTPTAVPAEEAKQLILRGEAPSGLHVAGHLDLSGEQRLAALPEHLTARRITLDGCRALASLPAGLRCYELSLRDGAIRALPDDLRVDYRLDLSRCHQLETLPAGLRVGSLVLRECTALRALPSGLDVYFLDIQGCIRLETWPEHASVKIGRLNARGCSRLATLPPWLANLAQLDVSGCERLADLPEGLRVNSWLDVAGTALRSLPRSLDGVQLRWRGVPIPPRVAFHPETITAPEVLGEANAEVRRVLLERMGYDVFLEQAAAEVLDSDADPGGARRLLRVELDDDEPLVCLSVSCPSTSRAYLLRVPPTMRSCREAAAWIAGFDDPDEYAPLAET